MRRAMAFVLAVGVAIGSSCSGDGDETASGPAIAAEPPGWEVIDGPDARQPLALEAEPLWGSDSAGPLEVVSRALFRDDDVVLLGGGPDSGGRTHLAVLDAATGQPRWILENLADLPAGDGASLSLADDAHLRGPAPPLPGHVEASSTPTIVDQSDGWAVLVEYMKWESAESTELGIAALSSEDGHVLWMAPVIPPRSVAAESEIELTIVGEGIAVASAVRPGPQAAADPGPQQLVAIDTIDGTTLWDEVGLRPTAIADDTVLAHRIGEDPDDLGSVVALDAATGETLWDLSDRYPHSSPVLAAGDLALVRVPVPPGEDTAPTTMETLVVEVRTGREVDSFGTALSPEDCAADDTVIACSVIWPGPEHRLATLQIEGRRHGVSETTVDQLSTWAVVDGRIVVRDGGRSDHPASLTLDRFGNVIDEDMPGIYIAMSDRYAIFETPPDSITDGPYAVHRITG